MITTSGNKRAARKGLGRSSATFGAALAGVVALATSASATANASANRLAGADRYGTSAAIASATFTTARNAVIASGTNFPDALAASYVAGLNHGPVLLTDPASLSQATANVLKSLGVQGVQIAGGAGAVSDTVAAQLQNAGYIVDRIWGGNRYATAAALADAGGSKPIGTFPGKGPTAILATGAAFADALSAGPIAYARNFPVLLTDPNNLSPEAKSAMTQLGIKYVLVFGGTNAVSSNIDTQLAAMGIGEQRVAGATRQDTATAAADLELNNLGFQASRENLARGDNFPDALAGGPHAGAVLDAILLTNTPDDLSTATANWLRAHSSTVGTIDVFGGALAISDATVAAAVRAAQGG